MERRKSRRFPVGWPVTIKGCDKLGSAFEETAMLANLSSAGAYLHTALELSVGARLDVSIRLPLAKERWMEYPAEIIRIDRPADHEGSAGASGTGIAMRFERIKPSFASH